MVREECLVELRDKLLSKYAYDRVSGLLHDKVSGKEIGKDYGTGYKQARVFGKCRLIHRLIYLMEVGVLPDLIDHIDRNSHNNRLSNLRPANKTINSINTGLPSNNKSGIKGVSWHKCANKWSAQIKHNGKKVHLGLFDSVQAAATIRLKAELECWYDFR